MKILIVDNHADYRTLLCEVFRSKGWETFEAPDDETALKILRDNFPDMVLSDVTMSRIDGFQLLRALRAMPSRDVVFIFYTSAYEQPEQKDFAMPLGADAFFLKPLAPVDIFTSIKAILDGQGVEGEREAIGSGDAYLRKHNLVLSEKLLKKALEQQKGVEEVRRDEEELKRFRRRVHGEAAWLAAPPTTQPALAQCPFTVSETIYAPINEIADVCEELTSRKRELGTGVITLVEQFCASMRRLRQLVSDLQSHVIIPRSELYAPMRRIQMLVEVLKKDYPAMPEWVTERITAVERHLRRFAELIDDLVKLISVTKAEIHPRPLDLTMLGRSLVEELRKGAPDRQAEIMIRDGMQATADRKLLRLALEQLLDNAWKYTHERRVARIVFDVMPVEHKHVFFIRDNGVGFSMDNAEQVFTAFHKLSLGERTSGNGIGLAIVKAIICRHGGAVWAAGEPGKGATFYFTLGGC